MRVQSWGIVLAKADTIVSGAITDRGFLVIDLPLESAATYVKQYLSVNYQAWISLNFTSPASISGPNIKKPSIDRSSRVCQRQSRNLYTMTTPRTLSASFQTIAGSAIVVFARFPSVALALCAQLANQTNAQGLRTRTYRASSTFLMDQFARVLELTPFVRVAFLCNQVSHRTLNEHAFVDAKLTPSYNTHSATTDVTPRARITAIAATFIFANYKSFE
jgi:hypothetical protein